MTKRILVVDDDELVLKTLSNLFIKCGWGVDICQNGEDGLRKIANESYVCVLLDIRMPGLNGTEVLEKIRGLEANGEIDQQNIIVMTGYSHEPDFIKVFQLGAWKYIAKPLDVEDLLKKIDECSKAYEARRAFDVPPGLEDDKQIFKKIRKLYDSKSLQQKADILSRQLNVPLKYIKGCNYDTNWFKNNIENPIGIVQIPLGITGPIFIKGKNASGNFFVPMATTEGALLLTYDLGMRLLSMAGPIETEVLTKCIHITPVFPIKDNEDEKIAKFTNENFGEIKQIAEAESRHTTLLRIEQNKVKDNFLLKFVFDTADAHGLNMINQATFNACKYIEAKTGAFFYLRSHFSGVKHHSLLNEEKGYGRCVRARGIVSQKALGILKVTATQMVDFGNRCLECGRAAGISSVNVHAANAIAAIFLACGQDAADLTSSAICSSRCEAMPNGKDLLVETVIKNLLVATVGGGTGLGTQRECLQIMDCFGSGKSDKFAEIIAAAAMAGEFTTAAAVINRTYVDIHNKYGRNKEKHSLPL